ncbi:hypothetical protein TNCT_36611 [Trichonephila clavata]|nr:hypothetical protein TNCT_36611 [Trichonephila clavata]
MRHIGSELKSIYSRATFSETSNIEDENTDSRISSTLDLVSSTTLELERGIKKSTECMELEESSKIVGTRKSWQKSGSLRKLQHSSIESTEGGKGDPLGIEEPITDVELAKSPEQMDVSLPSPDSTVPEGDQLHEMQSGPEHGLESKFQSEESGETPSEASDIKDGRPDSRLSSSVEPFSTSSDLSHGLGSSIESSESEGPTILRSAPKSSPKPCSLHKIHYATMTRVETIEEETRFDPLFEQQTEYFGMSLEEMGSPVEREFAPETADKDETVNHDITEKVQSESGDAAPERLLSGSETSSETRRPSVVLKSEEQSSKPERKQDSSSIATCAPKSGKRSRKKARLDKDKKVKHPASPKKRVRRRSSGSVSESTGELSGSGTNSDSNNSAGN